MSDSLHRRHQDVYRALTLLYPRDLRVEHGAEMVQVFGDLVRERGRRMWGRTVVDLAVSLPRTHMEAIMSTAWSRTVLLALTAILAAAAVVAIFAVGTPAIPFAVLLVGAAIAQRSRLARAVDGGPASANRTALAVLWLSALAFVGSVVGWVLAINRGDNIGDGTLLAYNAVGLGSLAGIAAASIVLVRRRRSRRVRA